MPFKSILLFSIFFGFFSCSTSTQKSDEKKDKIVQEPIITLKEPLKLNKEAAKNYAKWQDYQNFKEQFNQFLKTTQSEAFSNAQELNSLALQLKDSLKIESLKIPAFKARLNVLQSETMRLEDMMTISNLKTEDVRAQLIKILNAFNATNAKLNNLVVQQQLEKEILQLKDSL
ncbi:MAG: hypothetical protein QM486_07120 [Flavobacteriaceae bacterium]